LRRKLNEIELLYHVVDSDRIKAQRALAELEDEREKLKQGQLLL
jgi:hypothetical protein